MFECTPNVIYEKKNINIYMIKRLKVFAPAHITGFFKIFDNENPHFKGSRGAGIALDEGIITESYLKEGEGNVRISLNGNVTDLNTVSETAVKLILNKFSLDNSNVDIFIDHFCRLPISAGFGTSAGFSEGVCYTLPKLFGIDVTFKQAGTLSHLTEISESTGLGDVVSSINGGCVIRLKEGSPENAIIDKIQLTKPIYVFTKTLGLLETKEIIENPIHKKRINNSGHHLLEDLLKKPTVENFIKLSRRFADESQLITKEVQEILDIFDDETLGSSMAMLGNTAFALSETPDPPIENCKITKINNSGLKYIK